MVNYKHLIILEITRVIKACILCNVRHIWNLDCFGYLHNLNSCSYLEPSFAASGFNLLQYLRKWYWTFQKLNSFLSSSQDLIVHSTFYPTILPRTTVLCGSAHAVASFFCVELMCANASWISGSSSIHYRNRNTYTINILHHIVETEMNFDYWPASDVERVLEIRTDCPTNE